MMCNMNSICTIFMVPYFGAVAHSCKSPKHGDLSDENTCKYRGFPRASIVCKHFIKTYQIQLMECQLALSLPSPNPPSSVQPEWLWESGSLRSTPCLPRRHRICKHASHMFYRRTLCSLVRTWHLVRRAK
jgi:hypothetical protein